MMVMGGVGQERPRWSWQVPTGEHVPPVPGHLCPQPGLLDGSSSLPAKDPALKPQWTETEDVGDSGDPGVGIEKPMSLSWL